MTEVRNSVRMALLSARFESISRKMANTLFRSARSGVIAIGRDFSCCIVTRDHELLVSAESLPIHVLSGPDEMARTMQHQDNFVARSSWLARTACWVSSPLRKSPPRP